MPLQLPARPVRACRSANVIGPAVVRLRHARAWTQTDLVTRLELLGASATRDVIANIESGRTSASDTLVFAIATAFGVSPGELFPPVRPGQGSPRPGQVPFTAPRRRRGTFLRGASDEPRTHAPIDAVTPPH